MHLFVSVYVRLPMSLAHSGSLYRVCVVMGHWAPWGPEEA